MEMKGKTGFSCRRRAIRIIGKMVKYPETSGEERVVTRVYRESLNLKLE